MGKQGYKKYDLTGLVKALMEERESAVPEEPIVPEEQTAPEESITPGMEFGFALPKNIYERMTLASDTRPKQDSGYGQPKDFVDTDTLTLAEARELGEYPFVKIRGKSYSPEELKELKPDSTQTQLPFNKFKGKTIKSEDITEPEDKVKKYQPSLSERELNVKVPTLDERIKQAEIDRELVQKLESEIKEQSKKLQYDYEHIDRSDKRQVDDFNRRLADFTKNKLKPYYETANNLNKNLEAIKQDPAFRLRKAVIEGQRDIINPFTKMPIGMLQLEEAPKSDPFINAVNIVLNSGLKLIPGVIESLGLLGDIAVSRETDPLGGVIPFGGAPQQTISKLTTPVGKTIRETIDTYLPVDERRRGKLEKYIFPAIGTGLGFMLGGVVAKSAKIPTFVSSLLLSTSQAAEEYNAAFEKTGNHETAFKTFIKNLPWAATEIAPFERLFSVFNKVGRVKGRKLFLDMVAQGNVEGIQEIIQQFGTNLTAKEIYDFERELTENLLEGGYSGFFAGLFLQGLTHIAANKMDNGGLTKEEVKYLTKTIEDIALTRAEVDEIVKRKLKPLANKPPVNTREYRSPSPEQQILRINPNQLDETGFLPGTLRDEQGQLRPEDRGEITKKKLRQFEIQKQTEENQRKREAQEQEKLKQSKKEQIALKKQRRIDLDKYAYLTKQFRNAKRKGKLFHEKSVADLYDEVKHPEVKQKLEVLFNEVIESNRKLRSKGRGETIIPGKFKEVREVEEAEVEDTDVTATPSTDTESVTIPRTIPPATEPDVTPVSDVEVPPIPEEIDVEENNRNAAFNMFERGKKDTEVALALFGTKHRKAEMDKVRQWRKEYSDRLVEQEKSKMGGEFPLESEEEVENIGEKWRDKWDEPNLRKRAEEQGEVGKFEVKDIDVNEIEVDTKLFQNREQAFSKETYDAIVNDVKEGKFNWGRFDPIKVWRNPKDNKLYTLNHSRLKAFQDLAKLGYKDFQTIPAQEFKGSLEEAQRFAKEESNVLGARETDIERAKIYRADRERGVAKKDILEKAKKYEKRNAHYIVNLSYLNPEGFTLSSLKSLQGSGSREDLKSIEAIADWIGEVRQYYPEITNAHEDEMFKWLIKGGYEKVGSKREFKDRIGNIVSNIDFKPNQPLNLSQRVSKGYNQLEIESKIDDIRSEIKKLESERDNRKSPPSENRLNQISQEIAILNRELGKLYQGLRKAKEADQLQGDIFPSIEETIEEGEISNERKNEIIGGTNPEERGIKLTPEENEYSQKEQYAPEGSRKIKRPSKTKQSIKEEETTEEETKEKAEEKTERGTEESAETSGQGVILVQPGKYFMRPKVGDAFREVEGRAVKLEAGGDFFYTKRGNIYVIVEARTGLETANGKTLKEAIARADENIATVKRHGDDLEDIINFHIKQKDGLSPRYKRVGTEGEELLSVKVGGKEKPIYELTADELKNLHFEHPRGGSSQSPKEIFRLTEAEYETLYTLANSEDTFRFYEVLGKNSDSGFSKHLSGKIKNNEPITVYRAVEGDTDIGGILPGAYVTESKKYAIEHAKRSLGGKIKIVEMKVKPDELLTYDDPHEFIWVPKTPESAIETLQQFKPNRSDIGKSPEILSATEEEVEEAGNEARTALEEFLDDSTVLTGRTTEIVADDEIILSEDDWYNIYGYDPVEHGFQEVKKGENGYVEGERRYRAIFRASFNPRRGHYKISKRADSSDVAEEIVHDAEATAYREFPKLAEAIESWKSDVRAAFRANGKRIGDRALAELFAKSILKQYGLDVGGAETLPVENNLFEAMLELMNRSKTGGKNFEKRFPAKQPVTAITGKSEKAFTFEGGKLELLSAQPERGSPGERAKKYKKELEPSRKYDLEEHYSDDEFLSARSPEEKRIDDRKSGVEAPISNETIDQSDEMTFGIGLGQTIPTIGRAIKDVADSRTVQAMNGNRFVQEGRRIFMQFITPPPVEAELNDDFRIIYRIAEKNLNRNYIYDQNVILRYVINNFKDYRALSKADRNKLLKVLDQYHEDIYYNIAFGGRKNAGTKNVEQIIKDYGLNDAQAKVIRQLDAVGKHALKLVKQGEKKMLVEFRKKISDVLTEEQFLELFPVFKGSWKYVDDVYSTIDAIWNNDPQKRAKIADHLVEEKYKEWDKAFYLNLSRPLEMTDYIVHLEKPLTDPAIYPALFQVEGMDRRFTYFDSKAKAEKYVKDMEKKGWVLKSRIARVDELLKNQSDWEKIDQATLLHLFNTSNIEIPREVTNELLKNIKEGYWDKHTIRRNYTPGLKWESEELEQNIINLLAESSAKKNKVLGFALLERELSELEKRYSEAVRNPKTKEKDLRKLKQTLDYSQRFVSGLKIANNKALDSIRGMMYLWDLGFFRPAFMLQQITENLQTVMNLAISEAGLWKGEKIFGMAGKDTGEIIVSLLEEKLGKPITLKNKGLWQVIINLRDMRKIAPLGAKVLFGESSDPKIHYATIGKGMDAVRNILGSGGQAIEYATRIQTAATFYRIAKLKGMTDIDAITDYVADMIDIGKANYSKTGTIVALNPKTQRGMNEKTLGRAISQIFLVYKKWGAANSGLYRLLWNRSKVAFLIKTLVGLGVHGIKGFPVLSGLFGIASFIMGLLNEEPDKELQKIEDKLNEEVGGRLGSVLNRGVGTYFGVDLSNLMQESSALPSDVLGYHIRDIKSLERLIHESPRLIIEATMGRPFGFVEDLAISAVAAVQLLSSDLSDKERITREKRVLGALPATFRSFIQADILKKEGLKYGEQQIIRKENIKEEDVLKRRLGFQPEEFTRKSEMVNAVTSMIRKTSDEAIKHINSGRYRKAEELYDQLYREVLRIDPFTKYQKERITDLRDFISQYVIPRLNDNAKKIVKEWKSGYLD